MTTPAILRGKRARILVASLRKSPALHRLFVKVWSDSRPNEHKSRKQVVRVLQPLSNRGNGEPLVRGPAQHADEFLQKINLRKPLQPLEIKCLAHPFFEEPKSVRNKKVLPLDAESQDERRH